MKIKFGKPLSVHVIHDEWEKISYPIKNEINFYLITVAIGLLVAKAISFIFGDVDFIKKLYLLIPVLVVHELIHVLFLKKSKNCIIWINIIVVCVTSNTIMSKCRLLMVIIAPFLLLTVLPIVLFNYNNSEYFLGVAICNALISGADIISLFVIVKDKHVMHMMDCNILYGKGL